MAEIFAIQSSYLAQAAVVKRFNGNTNQGRTANKVGKQTEYSLKGIVEQNGFLADSQVDIGESIYGKRLICDLLVKHIPGIPKLIIEIKWQSTGGSVDEKYPYMVENIKTGRYPYPVIIIHGGGGAHPGAIKWLKSKIDGQRLLGVFSVEEFMLWLMNYQR